MSQRTLGRAPQERTVPKSPRALEPNPTKGYDLGEKEESAMQVNLPPDLETLVNKRLSSGGYTSAKMSSATRSKLRTPRKAGLTKNAGP
jgi:hypothetical protein